MFLGSCFCSLMLGTHSVNSNVKSRSDSIGEDWRVSNAREEVEGDLNVDGSADKHFSDGGEGYEEINLAAG
jgi:hypothetical protein